MKNIAFKLREKGSYKTKTYNKLTKKYSWTYVFPKNSLLVSRSVFSPLGFEFVPKYIKYCKTDQQIEKYTKTPKSLALTTNQEKQLYNLIAEWFANHLRHSFVVVEYTRY